MEVLARAVLVLLVATTAALSAPSSVPSGRAGAPGEQDAPAHQPQARVTRQAPGADILTRLSEAFRDKMQQKSEGVMDAMDQVGKALGAFGDTVHQAISDSITAGVEASGAEGQRATGVGSDQVDAGHKVGQVLSSIGDTLQQVVSGAGAGAGAQGQRTSGAGAQAAEPGPGAPLGHILSSIGDKLRTAAGGGEEGERALGAVGQQVGKVLATVGDTIRDVIRERQEGAEDDYDEARLVSEPAPQVDKVPCMNSTMMAMPGSRRRGRGRRAAAARAGYY